MTHRKLFETQSCWVFQGNTFLKFRPLTVIRIRYWAKNANEATENTQLQATFNG